MAVNKLKMTDIDILDYIKACYKESDDYFQTDVKPIMDECWDLYRIRRDYSGKEDWQAKHVNPRAFAAVEIATSLVKKSLMYVRDFFTVKGQENRDKPRENMVKEILLYYVRKAKFFVKFLESLKMALISGLGCIKIYWRRYEEEIIGFETSYEEQPYILFGLTIPGLSKKFLTRKEVSKTVQKSELVVESVDPMLLRIDPFCKISNRPKYLIEIEEVDFSTISKLASEGYYEDIDQLKETETISKTDEKYEFSNVDTESVHGREMIEGTTDREMSDTDKMKERKPIVLWHFWGDLEVEKEISPEKKLQLYENYNIVVANGKHIIRKKKNPNSHGKYPHIFIPGIIIPFKFYPSGIIEPIRSTLDYMDDLHNWILDALKFDVAPMSGVDIDALEDPANDLEIRPGGFIKARAGGMVNINAIIQRLTQSSPNIGTAMNMVQVMDRIVQLASGVVDPLMGMVTKGEQTATEFRGSLTQSTIKFESIARDIEEISLNPALEMVFQLVLQNMDVGMWMEITGEDGETMKEYITTERIEGNYDFYVTAITGYLSQLDYISKIVTIFSTMVQAAGILQLSPTEARKVFKRMVVAHGLKEIDEDISDTPQQMPMMPMQPGAEGGGAQPGETPKQLPNPNLAPENVMQMLAGKGGIM